MLSLFVGGLLSNLHAQTFEIVENGNNQVRLSFTTPSLEIQRQTLGSDTFNVIALKDFVSQSEVGAPSLPVYSRMIEIPLCDSIEVIVTAANKQVFGSSALGMTYPLMPQQPDRRKSDTSAMRLYKNNGIYATDALFANQLLSVKKVGIARDRNLANLSFSPIAYNPVTGAVEVYTDVQVELRYHNVDMYATNELKRLHHSGMFSTSQLALELPMSKSVRTDAPVRYTIVAHSMFRGYLDEFVAWKRHQGFLTDIVYTDDPAVGTTTASIAAFLENQYTQATEEMPAPTYVLLVGDVAQIPAFAGRASLDNDHVTDLYYFTWTPNDVIPDCYYGRFSAQTVAQLQNEVNKTLLYERYEFEDPSYLSAAVLIAGEDQGISGDNAYNYADPSMDYVAKYYVNAENGYESVTYYKNNTSFAPAGVTVTGCSQYSTSAAALRRIYDNGVGWLNYSAHGSATSWGTPNLTTSHISNMQNSGKPMFVIGNCCLTNKFETSECFGEAFFRKGDNAGAVGYIGGSNSTYWNSDFYWTVGARSGISGTMDATYDASRLGAYDRMFHTHGEAFSDCYITAGAMIMAGNLAVESYSSTPYRQYYWEVYHLMGDPSLMPWLGIPQQMNVSIPEIVSPEQQVMAVEVPPYAYVALLSEDEELISATFADGDGAAELQWGYLPIGNYNVVVSAQNYITYEASVQSMTLSGLQLMARSITPSNPLTNDTTSFSFVLANVGESDVDDIAILVRGNPTQIRSNAPAYVVPHLAAGESIQIRNVAVSSISADLRDGESIRGALQLFAGEERVEMPFRFRVKAPAWKIKSVETNVAPAAGCEMALSVCLVNNGSIDATNVRVSLRHKYQLSVVEDSLETLWAVSAVGSERTFNFNVRILALPDIPAIPYELVVRYRGTTEVIPLSVNYKSSFYDDFESGQINPSNWSVGMVNPWQVTSSDVYQGTYSARSYPFSSSDNNVNSDLTFTATNLNPDRVSFYYNVSSEDNYDKFHFYIDNVEQLEASGTGNRWTMFSCNVAAGTHVYKFSYTKDGSRTYGSDCAWIDNVTIPNQTSNCYFESDTACQGTPYYHGGDLINTDVLGPIVHSYTDAGDVHYLNLNVLSRPEVSIECSDTLVYPSQRVWLVARGGGSYLWDRGDTTDVIEDIVSEEMHYAVVGMRGGCSDTAYATIRLNNVAINPVVKLPSVKVYPNPVQSVVSVEAPRLRLVRVFDAQGRMVASKTVAADEAQIDVRKLAKGYYVVVIDTEEGRVSQRIVKQ